MDRILPNFVYRLTLKIARLGLQSVKFCKFATELQPLIDVRILCLLNILRMIGYNLINFVHTLTLIRLRLGL